MKLLKVTNSGLCLFQDAWTGDYEVYNLYTGHVLRVPHVKPVRFGEYLG